jgi:hypothetical protein
MHPFSSTPLVVRKREVQCKISRLPSQRDFAQRLSSHIRCCGICWDLSIYDQRPKRTLLLTWVCNQKAEGIICKAYEMLAGCSGSCLQSKLLGRQRSGGWWLEASPDKCLQDPISTNGWSQCHAPVTPSYMGKHK